MPEDMSSIHPLGLIELVTKHKLIGAIIALAVVVFLVSVTKIATFMRQERKAAASRHDDNESV